jgi:hypothetical protein
MTTLTIPEVLAALATAVPVPTGEDIPPNTYSGVEIRHAMGVGYDRFALAMKQWLAEGKVEVVQVRKRAMDGRLARTRNYRFVG